MKIIICLYIAFSAIVISSCTSQKKNNEYIRLKHQNIMVIKGDNLMITLVPITSKRKRPVIVKTLQNNQQYDRRRISLLEYNKIRNLILTIQQKDIELPKYPNKVIAIVGGGSNSIYFKKDNVEKNFYTHGISKEYYGKFYEATELILKAAKLEIVDVN